MGSLIKEKKKRISENTFSQFIIFIETKMAATFPKSSLFTIDPSSSQIVSLYSSLRGIFFYRGEMGSASRRTLRLPRDSSLPPISLILAHDQFQTFHPPLCNFEIGFGFALVISSISWVHLQPCAYSLLNRFAHPVDDSAFATSILSFSLFFLCFYLPTITPLITV